MRRFLCLAWLCLCMAGTLRACDVCGCSASNQYLGILPKSNLSFVGLQYQYSGFTTDHPSLFDARRNEHSADDYHTAQLWGRYVLGKRVQLFGFVPYRYNRQRTDTATVASAGLGDVSVLANVVLLREGAGNEAWQQQLLAGGGLKLPTGRYEGISATDRQGLPNMQPGTASWDFIVNANYTLRHGQSGGNLDAAYTLTTPNRERYKYGNRLNAGLLLFYAVKKGLWSILPQLGGRYEYTLHDYDNYDRKWLNEQNGGYLCYGVAGVQLYYRQLGLRLTYQHPLAQRYGSGYVSAGGKSDAGIFFLF